MYDNVGKKIMVLAQVVGWLCFIAGVIAGIALLASDNWLGWIMFGSGIVVLISSWFLYGFGQLVQDVHEIKDKKPVTIATSASRVAAEHKPTVSDELPDL